MEQIEFPTTLLLRETVLFFPAAKRREHAQLGSVEANVRAR
jgi:hypothetical protein